MALILFPILMATRPHPLVPLGLFRSRAFATINLATFFIYGALYVNLIYQGLVLQGVLGYTALAAGAIGVPAGILLTLLSARVGTVAGRRGPRRFLLAGPLLMALGTLWWARIPSRLGRLAGGDRGAIDPHPAGRPASSTCCPPCCSTGWGSRSSSRRSRAR